MAKMSRDKGGRGEREVRDIFRKHGFWAERGVQRDGSTGSPDVKTELDEWLHVEVKRVEALSLYKAMAQAKGDAGGRVPVVFHRRNEEEWVVIMQADDFMNLVLFSERS